MNFHTNPRLLLWVPTAVFAGLTAIIAVAPAMESDALSTMTSCRSDGVIGL